jgi:repressor LexA
MKHKLSFPNCLIGNPVVFERTSSWKGAFLTNDITARQQEIYDYVRAVLEKRGIPPSMREIGEHFGIRSTNGVHGHLAALERSGLITRARGTSRGIMLAGGGRSSAAIPLLGRVAAGAPVLSPENREGDVMVDLSLFSLKNSQQLFALKVKGESMVNAHILDGDTLLVRAQSTAENNDIIVALVEGEATVKRFFQEKDRIRLQPENSTMQPIYCEQGEFRVLGKAVGVIRKM